MRLEPAEKKSNAVMVYLMVLSLIASTAIIGAIVAAVVALWRWVLA